MEQFEVVFERCRSATRQISLHKLHSASYVAGDAEPRRRAEQGKPVISTQRNLVVGSPISNEKGRAHSAQGRDYRPGSESGGWGLVKGGRVSPLGLVPVAETRRPLPPQY
jgi:hypothetical protein